MSATRVVWFVSFTSLTYVYSWFVSLSTVGGFLCWMGMNVTYVNFYRGMKAQGIDRKKLLYYNSLQPWLSYWGIFWTVIFILVNGFACFWDFNASDFLTACASIPLSFACDMD